jgi:hypothetical protein
MISVDSFHHGPHGDLDQHKALQTRSRRLSDTDDLTAIFEAPFDDNVKSLSVSKNRFVSANVDLEHAKTEIQRVQESLTITTDAFLTNSNGQKAISRILKRDLETLKKEVTLKEAEFAEDILALKADNLALKDDNLALKADNLALKADHLALKADNLALKADNLALKADVLALHTKLDGLLDMFLQRR